jgi:hypothetical protein
MYRAVCLRLHLVLVGALSLGLLVVVTPNLVSPMRRGSVPV